ncbi:MAG: hypothetical protein ABIH42_05935 [Planctomycetota bacterium]
MALLSISCLESKEEDKEPVYYTLFTENNPIDSGNIIIEPYSIDGTYRSGTEVTLTASAGYDYAFWYWSGAIENSTNPVKITMNENKQVCANFISALTPRYHISVSGTPANSGSVTIKPESPDGCYFEGTDVTLSAMPSTGKTFTSWSGDITGASSVRTITIDSDITATANFAQASGNRYQIRFIGTQGGNWKLSPTSEWGVYDDGQVVTITAIPNAGYEFSSWGNDVSASINPIKLVVNSEKLITVTFVATE